MAFTRRSVTFSFVFVVLVLTWRWPCVGGEGAAQHQQTEAERLRPLLHPTYNDRILLFARDVRLAQQRNALGGSPAASAHAQDVRELAGAVSGMLSQKEIQQATRQSLQALQGRVFDVGDVEQNVTVSELCLNHTMAFLFGLLSREPWAVEMLDAMGKPRPDIQGLNVNWPGAYHQCVQVRANTSVVSHPLFSGRYCTATAVPPETPSVGFGVLPAGILFGLCVPDTCSETDVALGVQQVLKYLNTTQLTAGPVLVAGSDSTVDARAGGAIFVCVVIAMLLVLGTALDIALVQRPQWRLESSANIAVNGFDQQDERHPLLTKSSEVALVAPALALWSKALISFSVWTNGRKLLATSQPEGSLTCIHGVRFLSMTWVVLGHSVAFPAGLGENVSNYLTYLTKRWTFQALANATFSVDSFFLLSGLLVAFLTLREMKKNNGKLNWFLFFFHRFWRLTPVYMLCIMIYVCFFRYWGDGPFWPQKVPDRDNCEQYWWTNLLYINNLVHFKEGCFVHSWYLANDMQFYILSPIILVPLYFFPFVGLAVAVVFLLVTSVTPALLVMKNGFPPGLFVNINDKNLTNLGEFMDDFYIKPYNRMGPYVVGMLAGYFLFRTDCRWRINKYVNLFLWAVATASALAVIYGLYDNTNGHPVTIQVSAFYNAVSRHVWGACVAWVIIACVTGNGGFVNTMLSWPALIPLSRLTYCIYLIHLMVINVYLYNLQDLFYMSDLNVVALFLAVLVISYMAAFVVSLAFEAPMMGLEKVIMSALSSRRLKHP